MKFRYMAVGACWAGLAFAVMTAKGAEENMTHESGLLCSVFVAKPTEHSVTMSIVNGEKPFTGQLCTACTNCHISKFHVLSFPFGNTISFTAS